MRRSIAVVVLALLLPGCGADDDGVADEFVFQELAEQGLTRYVGGVTVAEWVTAMVEGGAWDDLVDD